MKKKLGSKNRENDENDSSQFPCLLCFCDNKTKFFHFDENGNSVELYSLENFERMFLGLAKCILDTNVRCSVSMI